MERHYTIHIRARNEHAVLQRMLLVFSRRRLRIRALQFFDVDDSRAAEMQVDLACRPDHVRDVVAGLRAVVEVRQVWAEEVSLQARTAPVAA
jgi:acetolactate synthase small subunit